MSGLRSQVSAEAEEYWRTLWNFVGGLRGKEPNKHDSHTVRTLLQQYMWHSIRVELKGTTMPHQRITDAQIADVMALRLRGWDLPNLISMVTAWRMQRI